MKECCAHLSKRMFPSVLIRPAETVATGVFRRHALQTDTGEGVDLVTVVSVGTCVLLVVCGGDGCTLLVVGGGCTLPLVGERGVEGVETVGGHRLV